MKTIERLVIWIITLILSIAFAYEIRAETSILIGVDTRHYLYNQTLNNNNYILGLKVDNFTIMSMNNSNKNDSYGLIYTNNITENFSWGISAFSGYNYYRELGWGDFHLMHNILINDNILVFPLIVYRTKLINDLDLNFVFTPTNMSTIISIKIK